MHKLEIRCNIPIEYSRYNNKSNHIESVIKDETEILQGLGYLNDQVTEL